MKSKLISLQKLIRSTPPVFLAPLAGISSLPFRIINRRFGCQFAFLEMIHARSLSYKSKKTLELLRTDIRDRPLGVQLLGADVSYLKDAIEKLRSYKFDILDFNAACPKKKITAKGEGAALLKTPLRLHKLLKIIVKHSNIPVTVKIRLGWDKASDVCDIVQCAADAGISAIFVHGRTKVQGYSGQVDYQAIRKVKSSLHIPVIASGNILTAQLAKKMFDQTGCDGIVIARGALGNPWIFNEICSVLKGKSLPPRPKVTEIAQIMNEHFHLCVSHHQEMRAVLRFRKFFIWYTRGIQGIKSLRIKVMRVKTKQAMEDIIEEFRLKNSYY